nr:chemotaxis protein CheW [Aquabacterium terrae]
MRIRLGGAAYALRLAEVAGLHAGQALTPLPGAAPELAGLTSIGGRLVAVYHLRRLLGIGGGGGSGGDAPRWWALAAARPLALAFDGFDGSARLASDALVAADADGGAAPAHVRTLARLDGAGTPWCPVIELTSVLAALDAAAPPWRE